MATYLELRSLFNDGDLNNKMEVAVIIAAQTLIAGTPSAQESAWAAKCFSGTKGEAAKALMGILASNKGSTVTQIQGASDSVLQTAVDGIVPTLVLGV